MTSAAIAGLLAWGVGRRLGFGSPVVAGTVVGATVLMPTGGAALSAVLLARHRWRNAAAVTRARQRAERDVVLLADLVVLGVTAGLSLRAAFAEAGRHVGGVLGGEVETVLGEMDRIGAAGALASAGGRLAELGRVVAGAALSGAPVAGAVAGFAAARRHAEHAAQAAAARRLPVRLLVPLALLILPGFVVLTVGPALLQALARLGPIP